MSVAEVTILDGWKVRFRPLHPSDLLAKGVEGRVAVTAVRGSRVIKAVIEGDAVAAWRPVF